MAYPLELQWSRDGPFTDRITDFVIYIEFKELVNNSSKFGSRVQTAIVEIWQNINAANGVIEEIVRNANRGIQIMTETDANRMVYQRLLADMRGIRLHIQLQNGNGVEVAVESDWRVLRLKTLLQQKTQIDVSEQRLFYGSNELHDTKTLSACALANDSTLSMKIVRASSFVIFVEGADNTRHLITINGLRPESRVRELLEKVEERVGTRDAYLTFQGRRLEERETLKHYNIKSEATVHYNQRTRGG